MSLLPDPFFSFYTILDIEKLATSTYIDYDTISRTHSSFFISNEKLGDTEVPVTQNTGSEIAATAILAYVKILNMSIKKNSPDKPYRYLSEAMKAFNEYALSCIIENKPILYREVCKKFNIYKGEKNFYLAELLINGFLLSKGVCYSKNLKSYVLCYAMPLEMTYQAKILKEKYL